MREEHAGALPENAIGGYSHRMYGGCPCGQEHNPATFGTNGHQSKAQKVIAATYDYTDGNGQMLYQAVRYEPKGFSQRRPDGKGNWIWNLDSVGRVLYRLPELIDAPLDAVVFIPEGEKDVKRLMAQGLVATCNSEGAKKFHRVKDLSALKARSVAILEDNDKDGQEHSQQVARCLHGISSSVKVIALPGLPDKGDVSDWLDNGNSITDLLDLVDAAPEWEADPDDTGQYGPGEPPFHDDWGPLEELPEPPTMPSLPPELVPRPFRAWLQDVADHAGIPLEMVAPPAIVSAGSVVGCRIGIRPNRFDHYLVVTNLWGAVIARSGSMKSYGIDEAVKPLKQLAVAARDQFMAEDAESRAYVDRLKAEIEGIKLAIKAAAKGTTSKTKSGAASSIDDLQAQLSEKMDFLESAVPR